VGRPCGSSSIEVVDTVGEPAGPNGAEENLLIVGDSGDALRALSAVPEWAARYRGKVKLVYIDPPFNTEQTFEHYADQLEHSIWLTMMRDRIRDIKPLLHEDASVWVHLDDSEVHRMRVVLDEELGAENFVATIVWEKSPGSKGDAGIAVNHDYILIYARNEPAWKKLRNRIPRSARQAGRYANPDNDPRGPWRQGADGTAKSGNDDLRFEVTTPSGRVVTPPKGNYWRFSKQTLETARAEGRVWFGKKGDALPVIKTYLSEIADGVVPGTWWPNHEAGSNQEAKRDHLRKLFPDIEPFSTPKPERLLQRILQIGSNPGDLVLDAFAGSGTTAAVAQKMGRRWVTIELSTDNVERYTLPRLRKVVNNADPWGITSATERVAVSALPEGVSAQEAQQFTSTFTKLTDGEALPVDVARAIASVVRDLASSSHSPISQEEAKTLLALLRKVTGFDVRIEVDVMPQVRALLREKAKTRDETTTLWDGGGGLTVARVGPSMYEVDDDGEVFLSAAATNGAWSKAVAGQLKFTLTPDHPVFCGLRNRQRLAVIDGVVDETIVRTVVEHLHEKEKAVVVGKGVLPEAEALLAELSPGSRIRKAPGDLFGKATVR
jgi:adenine-specific DNA-methyltransferase